MLEEFERVVANRGVLGFQPDIHAVEVVIREQQLHQPEDPLEVMLQRRRGPRVTQGLTLAQQLVRTVVTEDFGREHRLEQFALQMPLRMQLSHLVESGDDAQPHERIPIEQVFDEEMLGIGRADPLQNAWHFRPES